MDKTFPFFDLDYILSKSCANQSDIEGYNVYEINVHCICFKVIAKEVGDGKYDVISFTESPA